MLIIFTVLTIIGYPLIFESATRGRTLGKMALGLRVVSDDGGPERFRQALFRALASFVEIWMFFGGPAVICSLLSPKGKRIGDVFAGTVVISERGPKLPPPPVMPPSLAWWASSLQLSGLGSEQAELARQFLSRASQLDPRIRDQMAYRIAGDVVSQISPPHRPAFLRSTCWPRCSPSGTVGSSNACGRYPWRLPPPHWGGRSASGRPRRRPAGASAAGLAACAIQRRLRAPGLGVAQPDQHQGGRDDRRDVRAWFHAVHVEKYACHSRAASATENVAGSTVSRWMFRGTLNTMVMIAPSTPKIAPASSQPLPGLP